MYSKGGVDDSSLLHEKFTQLIETEVERRLEAEVEMRAERERQERDLVLLVSRLRTPCSGPASSDHPHTAPTCRSPFSFTLSAFSSTELPRLLPGRRYLSVSARSESATWGQCWRGYQECGG